MSAPSGSVRVCRSGDTLTFQLEGWARLVQGLTLRQFTEQTSALAEHTLHIDLRHCNYMDSTFLGTLLHCKRAVERRGGSFALVSPSPACTHLLRQMKLDSFFPVVTQEEDGSANWTELTGDPACDAERFQQSVIDAHRQLAEIPGPTGEPFREVVRLCERELDALKGP